MKRTISAMVGKGSLNHNSRAFYAPNVDPSRSHLNVEYCKEDIRTVYHELFDAAQRRYNAKQTRNDRCIADYYEKIASSRQEKPFHEIVLQIGNKDDTGIGSETADLARQCLEAYVRGFQARNHTLRMFSAHLHMDEATPHVHIDFVPYITGSKRGMDTRVSLKQALAKMGFVGGTRSATEWNLWVQREKQVLADIMQEHGIEWEQLGTHEEHLSVLEYKKQERSKEVKELDSTIAQKRTEVEKIEDTLQAVQKQVVDLDKIEAVSAKKALLSDRVTLPRSDFEMQSLREGILDIAGVRVVCNYLNDVNLVADLLLSQDDIRLLKKKDFISNPKSNGYRSLHLIVSVPIFLAGTTEHIPVEIQIRTIAMDYWASLEHHLKYKTENDVSDSLKCRLKHDADLLSAIDADLQDIFCQMNA